MASKTSDKEIQRFADAYNEAGSIRAAAKAVGCSHGKSSYKRYKRAVAAGLIESPGSPGGRTRDDVKDQAVVGGRVRVLKTEVMP